MHEIAPGIWLHQGAQAEPDATNLGDVAHIGFVIGQDCVAVIDGGASLAVGRALRAALQARSAKPVCQRIATHMHPDHVLGLAAFDGAGPGGQDPQTVGHARLAAALAVREAGYRAAMARDIGAAGTSPAPPRPDLAVEPGAERTLALGGLDLRLQAHPPAHTDNDLTVWAPQARVLWTGDLLFHGRVPALDGRLRGWQAWTRTQQARDCTGGVPSEASPRWVVPGHGPLLTHDGQPDSPWCTALADQSAYLDALVRTVKTALEAGLSLGDLLRREAQAESGERGGPIRPDGPPEPSDRDAAPHGGGPTAHSAAATTVAAERWGARSRAAAGWALHALYHRRNLSAAWAELEWE